MGLDPEGFRLDGKVAVVTGGGAISWRWSFVVAGIGRGIANGLATFGAMVAIWERDPDTCASAAAEVDGLPVPTDVRDGAQVDTAVRATLAEYGTIDVLVN